MNCGPRPIIPIVDVQVGAADSRAKHANLDVVDAGLGLGNIFEPEASRGPALNEGFHSECPPALLAGSAKVRIRERRLFALRPLRACGDWSPGPFRPVSRRAVSS